MDIFSIDRRNEHAISAASNEARLRILSWQDAAPYCVALLFGIALVRHTLTSWWWAYTQHESYYSHAILIPFMIGFMLWSHRERILRLPMKPVFPALGVLAATSFLQVYAARLDMEAIKSLSLLLMIWSAVWFVFGTAFVRSEFVPLLFLFYMAPLPGPLLNDATHGIQQWSTTGASRLLGHIGFDNMLAGYEIQMENYTLFVDVPCSGFKTLLALVTFNTFFAYMLDGSAAKRIALFLAAMPLALVINILRISLIAIVGESISDQAAHVFHDYSGLITLLLGFAFIFGLARLFGCRKFAGLAIF